MADMHMKSLKHSIIAQTNTFIVVAVGVAVFVFVFCGFAVKTLVNQSIYQRKVITEKELARDTLILNETAAQELRQQYIAFSSQAINVLGGNPVGEGPLDGDNPRIILDALPSEYDFPALSSSIEKILTEGGFAIQSIGGSENSLLAGTVPGAVGDTPEEATPALTESVAVALVEIPYPISINASPTKTLELFSILQRSIRPFRVDSVSITFASGELSTSIAMTTFYQPETGMKVSTKVIK